MNKIPTITPNVNSGTEERIIVIFDQNSISEVEKLVKSNNFEFKKMFKDPEINYYKIVAPIKENLDLLALSSKLDDVVEKILQIQMNSTNTLDKKEFIKSNTYIDAVAQVITKANKNLNINEGEAILILSNVFKELVRRSEHGLLFFDDNEISELAKAAMAKELKDTKLHLEELFLSLIVKVTKLYMIWTYDATKISYSNYLTDKKEIPLLQNHKEVSFLGEKHIVTKLNLKLKEDTLTSKGQFLFFNEETHNIVSIDAGKKARNHIQLFLHSVMQGNAIINLDQQLTKMFLEIIYRVKREVSHQLIKYEINFEDYNFKELETERASISTAFEGNYRILVRLRDSIVAKKRDMLGYYKKDYSKMLAREFGGSIPLHILEKTPIKRVEDYDELINQLDKNIKEFEELSINTQTKLASISTEIKNKKFKNAKKIYAELKDLFKIIVNSNLFKPPGSN